MLSLTDGCNLDCIYCYQSKKRSKVMSVDMAKKQISKHIQNASDYDEVVIDVTGGEVFLQFDLLKEICEWTWSIHWPKPILFFATSNGTLIHGDIRKWLTKNKDKFWVGVSIDGTREMHNKNRSNSYDLIDFKFFLKNWPSQTIKMTISPESLPNLSEGILEVSEMGFNVHASFAQLCDWSKPEYKDIFKRELHTLADYYINHPDIKVTNLLDMPLDIMICNRNIPTKWCGTGKQMVSVDFDGKEYPCPLFMPSAMDTSINWKTFDLNDPKKLCDSHCNGCLESHVCPNCYGANIIQNGNPSIRDKSYCEFTKIRALATSYLVGKKLSNGLMKIENQTKLNNTILAIKELQGC